ncbi:MAG: four helix bundle protein [Clostridia bacterium]|nr:four helix bundle protein [Clostridia bacterium]
MNNNYITNNKFTSKSIINSKSKQNDILYMLPKMERHIEYVLGVVLKLPRTEKFNIGQEIKLVVYDTLKNVLLLSKISVSARLSVANVIDANIAYEKALIRIMYKFRYIDNKKYMYMMDELIALGNMLGAYIKYLNNTKE